jgi:putative transposase
MRLRREGWRVNHKTVERLYREEGLSLRRRARKNATAVPRVALPLPSEPGRCYAMDCVRDRLAIGRRFKCVTMTDFCSKEVAVIEVDASIGRERVCRILDRLFAGGPLPEIGSWTTDRNSQGRHWMCGPLRWGDAARHPAGEAGPERVFY